MTDEIGIATMNHAMMRVRYSAGNHVREIERDAWKESGLRRAEQRSQHVEARRADGQAHRRGDQAPRDHDARDPDGAPDAVEREVARDLEQAVAEEEECRSRSRTASPSARSPRSSSAPRS